MIIQDYLRQSTPRKLYHIIFIYFFFIRILLIIHNNVWQCKIYTFITDTVSAVLLSTILIILSQLVLVEKLKGIPTPKNVHFSNWNKRFFWLQDIKTCSLLKDNYQKSDGNTDYSNLTLYSTMEPCSKRLSGNISCTQRIIDAKVNSHSLFYFKNVHGILLF